VNPDDERYKELVGRKGVTPVFNRGSADHSQISG
jgi:valyl-tRNA synthetase